jgi:hypothetical protein
LKHTFSISVAICFVGIAFGYWGAFTRSGEKHFEEMAGLLPFYILVGSAALFTVAVIILVIKKTWARVKQ